ncbi:MAG TPA: RNA methyltransferase [Planctomycetota bacterium]|nr:RNA methyltransferase [Planctomycetota bacterium]
MVPARKEISSGKNPAVHRFREAAQGALEGVMLAEGVRLVAEALDAGLPVLEAAVSPRFADAQLRARLQAAAHSWLECSDDVLARMSALDTPQGVAVLLGRPQVVEKDLVRGDLLPLVVIVAGVRDPGNLGSLLRTAEAAGATGCLSMKGGADPFRDKAVRGSMGSIFRLPVLHGFDAAAVIDFARRHRLRLVVADGAGQSVHTDVDLRQPLALVVGAEAAGVPGELLRAADARVRIPLREPVDSLNVAVAAGVLLFEAQRQRR